MTNNSPITIIYVHGNTVACTGEDNDHPKVWYTIPDQGEAVCGYCDIKYRNDNELPKRR